MQDEHKSVEFKYGILMLRTKKFAGVLDRLGRFRVTGPLAWVLLYIMPLAAAIAFLLEFVQLSVILSPQGAVVIQYIRTITPLANLLLPGINPYLPIVDGWLALIIAMVVHEGAHGVVARSLNLPVKSAGLLLFLVFPIGAFVEIDDKELKAAKARDSTRVLAAGAGVNLVVAVVCLVLLTNVVATMTPAAEGAGVVSVVQDSGQLRSPAYLAGIRPGDYVLSMNGKPIYDAINDTTIYKPQNVVNITILRSGTTTQLNNIVLSNVTVLNTKTNQTYVRAFLGINPISPSQLREKVSTYLGDFLRIPTPYVCIPTFPRCQDFVPYSDEYVGFYASSVGSLLPMVTNLLFWVFFINFNLAIFNSLPIYPLDGGQAFDIAVKTLGRGRLSEAAAGKITAGTTAVIVSLIAFLLLYPYLI